MSTVYPTGPGCTCGSCPVHGKPPCPSCGARGAHYCPGPPPKGNPDTYKWHQPYGIPCATCGRTGPHTCVRYGTYTIN